MATQLHAIQVIVLFLLFLVAAFAAIAQRIKIPNAKFLSFARLLCYRSYRASPAISLAFQRFLA